MSYVCFFVRVVQAACLAARLAAPAVTCVYSIVVRTCIAITVQGSGPLKLNIQLAVRM